MICEENQLNLLLCQGNIANERVFKYFKIWSRILHTKINSQSSWTKFYIKIYFSSG